MRPVVVVLFSQLLFTAGDLLARAKMRQLGFHPETFLSWWFAGYMTVRMLATFGQLWVLSQLVLSRSMALYSATALVLSIALSVIVLREGLTARTLVGGLLAVWRLSYSRTNEPLAALKPKCEPCLPGAAGVFRFLASSTLLGGSPLSFCAMPHRCSVRPPCGVRLAASYLG